MHIQKRVAFLLGEIHRPHPFQPLYPSSIDGVRVLKGRIVVKTNLEPLLKKTAPSHWKRPETSQKRLGELDAPQVRSYRTVNGVLHRSLQWERPKSDEPRHPSHECDARHKREAARCQMLVKWFRQSVRNLSHSMVLYLPLI